MNKSGIIAEIFKYLVKMSEPELIVLHDRIKESMQTGRRRHLRKQYGSTVSYSAGGRIFEDVTKDISLSGVLIETQEPRRHLSLGQSMNLVIPDAKNEKLIKILGKIVRIAPNEIAVEFTRILFQIDS